MGKEIKKSKERGEKQRRDGKKVSRQLTILSGSEFENVSAAAQSKTKIDLSNSDDSEWELVEFSPMEGNINNAHHLTWNIGGYRDAEFKFDPINTIVILWKFSITVREYDESAKVEKSGTSDQKINLKPEFHGVWPWPTSGALGYFRAARCSYNSQITNDLEIALCANLDELNTLQTMDLFLNPDEKYLQTLNNFGRTYFRNNSANGSTFLKEKLGTTPNLNYPDNSAKAVNSDGEGYFYSFGSFPCMPFQKFSPRMRHLMNLNSGGDNRQELNSVIFPSRTSIRIELEKTPSSKYLHSWYFPAYTDQMGSKVETITLAQYRTFKNIDNSKTYIIKDGHCDVQNVFLRGYVRPVLKLQKKNFPIFDTYCTVRRLHEQKLDSNRYPIFSYFNDTKHLGLGFFITFRRGLDLDADPTQEHPFSSSTCFRPNTLDRITILEGADQGGDPRIFQNFDIKGLSTKKNNITLKRYASYIQRAGFISEKHSRTFWELPFTEQTSQQGANVGDTGICNFFPISLLSHKIRKNFVYFSTHNLRSENLMIKLEFTQPLLKTWYLVIVSEYLVSIKFDPMTGAPTFKYVEH